MRDGPNDPRFELAQSRFSLQRPAQFIGQVLLPFECGRKFLRAFGYHALQFHRFELVNFRFPLGRFGAVHHLQIGHPIGQLLVEQLAVQPLRLFIIGQSKFKLAPIFVNFGQQGGVTAHITPCIELLGYLIGRFNLGQRLGIIAQGQVDTADIAPQLPLSLPIASRL